MESQDFSKPTREELALIAAAGGYDISSLGAKIGMEASLNGSDDKNGDDSAGSTAADFGPLTKELARTVVENGPDAFAEFADANSWEIAGEARQDPQVADMLLACYRYGIAQGSGTCANDLGALYYTGRIFEQDFGSAAALYGIGTDLGCQQSIINLGYIYEYGRLGSTDYARAFECYSLAAALEPSCEATYKMGDMYARGQCVEKNMGRARMLWERSLELADSLELAAQPSARIAPLLIGCGDDDSGAPYDPLRALGLYQQAEMGLRISIAGGQLYYRKRLQEVLEGQERCRDLLDQME